MAEHESTERQRPPLTTFAERLEYLFDTIRPTRVELAAGEEPGRRYNNREIADKINLAAKDTPGAPTISAAYIGELRRGVATDPRTSHLQALARAFGVDGGFFLDDHTARRVQEQIALLLELRRLLADSGLSQTSAVLVEQMVARLREVEGQVTNRTPPGAATTEPR